MSDSELYEHDDDARAGIPPYAAERRSAPRRADDLVLGHVAWLEWVVLHRGKFATLAALLGSLVTFLATTMAMRMVSERDMVALTHTVSQHDSAIISLDHRMGTVEESQRFQDYLSCVLVRRVDPTALPPKCQSVINAQGAP